MQSKPGAVLPIYSRWSEIADFELIFAFSASAVTPSERSSINSNRKSTTRFPMSLRWSSYVVPKPANGGLKTQNGRFPSKIALRLKKVCYQFCLCENCLRESGRAFIGGSALALHCCIAHAKINRKMENSTPCKIVTPENFNLKHCTCDYVGGRLPTMQILVLIGTVGLLSI